MDKQLIQCKVCGMKINKELVAIECPRCYTKGFDKERSKIVDLINNFKGEEYTDLDIWEEIKQELVKEIEGGKE